MRCRRANSDSDRSERWLASQESCWANFSGATASPHGSNVSSAIRWYIRMTGRRAFEARADSLRAPAEIRRATPDRTLSTCRRTIAEKGNDRSCAKLVRPLLAKDCAARAFGRPPNKKLTGRRSRSAPEADWTGSACPGRAQQAMRRRRRRAMARKGPG